MTIPEIQEHIDTLIIQDKSFDGFHFLQKLEKSIEDNNVKEYNPEAFKKLTKILFSLYVFTVPHLEFETIEKMITYNLKEALDLRLSKDIFFMERLEKRYTSYPSEMFKYYLCLDFFPIAQKSQQKIGDFTLHLSTDTPNARSTIENWFKYYDRKTGMDLTSNFERAKFLSQDDYVAKLNDKDKESLRKVLFFYDYLQDPSYVFSTDFYELEPSTSELVYEDSESQTSSKTTSHTSLSEETSDENSQQEPSKPQSSSQPSSSSQDKKTQAPPPQPQSHTHQQSSSETYRPSPSARQKKSPSSQAKPLKSSQTINLKEVNSKK